MNTPHSSRYKKVSAAVVALAAAFAFRRIEDFDTWWHLAAGRWIAGHAAIPVTDTLSHTVRNHPWINLQWAFDLVIYTLHRVGGPSLLVWVAAAAYAFAIGIVFGLVKKSLGGVGAGLLMFPVVLAAQDRFEVRPEMLSLVLLGGVLWVLEAGRMREGRGLWRLVPLMLIWVNVHALFVIGILAIVCALAASWAAPSRKLLLWGGVAVAAVFANPFGAAGVLLPMKLLSRINGSDPIFQTIAEFRSPFAADATGTAFLAYKLLLVTSLAAVVARLLLRRPMNPGGLVFFLGLGALSIVARRNTALFAIGGAPYAAQSLAIVASALPQAWRQRMSRLAPVAGGAVIVGAILLIASIVTGAFYRFEQRPREFGAGILDGTFPIRAAAAAREATLPAKLYNDVAAGGYLAWDDPLGDGVFIDGRLEVYDAAFFSEYVAGMYDPARFEATADRYGINTVILFHRWENRRLMVQRLYQGGDWALVYADEVAAIFVRARGNDGVIQRAASMNDRWNAATRTWLDRPIPAGRYLAGRVEGTRAFARLLATVGDAEGAAETYQKLLALGISSADEVEVRLLLARRYAGTDRADRAREEARRILAIDPSNVEAQQLLR